MKTITLIGCCLCLSTGLFCQSKQQDIPQLAKLKELFRADSVLTPVSLKLPNGMKAITAVFRRSFWSGGIATQQEIAVRQGKGELVQMNTQLWLISLADYPDVDGSVRNSISPLDYPSAAKREMAFVGKGYGFAWCVYAPVQQWIYIPGILGLQGGEDPIDAAISGLSSPESSFFEYFLSQSLPEALPRIEQAMEKKNISRYSVIQSVMSGSDNEEVIRWLVRHSSAKEEDVADAARYCLIHKERKEFMPLYREWLRENAGNKDVIDLLHACKKVQMPDLATILPLVLNSPASVDEYRLAFDMNRELAGKGIPKDLLDAEATICQFGRKRSFEQTKVDSGLNRLLASRDYDAIAAIGLSLSNFFRAKANWDDYDAIHSAGIRILRSLPDDRGSALVERVALSSREYDRNHLENILKALRDQQEQQ